MRRPRSAFAALFTAILAALFVACSPAPNVGTLTVSVDGLPGGVAGSVLVTGPNSYSQVITASTTLSVPPGTYSVAVKSVQGTEAIVPVAYDGGAAPTTTAVVVGGSASTTVTYAVRPGSGHLWLPQFSGSDEAVGYASGQLSATGSPSPSVSLAGTTNTGETVAFDGEGNMWVSDFSGYLYRYAAASLAGSGMPTPEVTIDATAYGPLLGLAFDASGNLWTTDFFGDRLLGYSPAQLATDGAPTPAVVISASGASLLLPAAIAFDKSGGLWITNRGNDTVVQFSPAQLAATGTPVPAVTLSANAGSLAFPYALAFDGDGNLWVANLTSTVVRFDMSQLASTSSPTPAATIAAGSLGSVLVGLAFDVDGGLWVAANNSTGPASEVRRFTNPGALMGSATPTASVIIDTQGPADGMHMAFSPTPANLPINTP